MPAACLLLLRLSLRPATGDLLEPRAAAALAAAFGAASLACLWAAGLFAASLDWESPLVDAALAAAFALLGLCALAAFASRRVGLVGWTWTAAAAAVLWVLCAPLPPGTYARLALFLQFRVTDAVMETLGLLGVAARQHGNVIELARGAVGVEEACSGVRSLVSCVFAGLFLSAALVRRPVGRVLLVALSAPLALAMNFLRSLLLTLLVNSGADVAGGWHDATGYGILAVTALILFVVSAALGRGDTDPAPAPRPARPAPGGAGAALGAVLACAAVTLAFFLAHTGPPAAVPGPAPDLLSMMPGRVPGWSVATSGDLYRFAGILRTRHLAQRTYRRGGEQVTLYAAYWSPGQASVGLVASHTPDACWPGTGWTARAVDDPHPALSAGNERLPPAQHRSFVSEGYPQQVWYWQLVNGGPVQVGDPRSVTSLLRIASRYGIRRAGAQAFVRISSNRPWDEISGEPFVAQFLGRTKALGLY
jgi:exosortase